MKSLIGADLDAWVFDHTAPLPQNALFERLREETFSTMAMPQMQVGRVEGQVLRTLVALTRARTVVELGTFTGYSALAMASALPSDGRVITCDIDPVATAVARRYFDDSPWGARIEIALGPGLETLARLRAESTQVDLAFIDADKANYVHYYDALVPLLSPGGLIVADNVLWSGAVVDPKDPSDHALAAFSKHVRDDPRTEQVILSVRDGMMLARLRG